MQDRNFAEIVVRDVLLFSVGLVWDFGDFGFDFVLLVQAWVFGFWVFPGFAGLVL